MASSKADQDLEVLKSTVSTTLELITKLKASAIPAKDAKDSTVNAVDLAHDAASLTKAHTTKLSLLIINKPFTASAIAKILRELMAGPLPGLASAVELCSAGKYTKAMSSELEYWAGRVFQGMTSLAEAIPLDGSILSEDAKKGTGTEKGNGSLALTGTVWEACDAVAELKKLGVVGLVIKKVEEYKSLLQDALEELQEWGEEGSDNEDTGFDDDDDPDEAQAAVDSMFLQRHIPSEDPDKIRPRLDSSLKRLRLLILMYQAVVKRRFKALPSLPLADLPPESKTPTTEEDSGIVNCVDEALDVMKKIPGITDDLASAFYELDGPEIDKKMDLCFFTGFAAAELLVKDWQGRKDEFTTWATKFQLAMKKGW
ncbi:uncharacterized protein LY89DRAFT_579481 [Mollisia scopiformis]|uniref:Cyclin-D1-binding protein 1-like N-terminal domain-containing protein n=1 Tax=Mollisia scopiformis TaxID=149040 RepID=A0A194XM50_MOLSC|nr:uncharacterized protein LY89DRAFT_579481 [Mollisia scopiformis]KUJ20842.1 hypothetical protein LY89DRAFT_579481 [Mollisia scopiformis]